MRIKRERLKGYSEYLREALDPWKMKQGIKSFYKLPDEKLTIHGDLKDLSESLTRELSKISLPYSTLLEFGGIEIDIKIVQSNRYYSHLDWIKFLSDDFQIEFEVKQDYDPNYLVSTIVHEIRHIIDFTDENMNNGLSSFDMDRNLRRYNIPSFHDFFTLVYISLEHELVARNNQVYPYIKFKNLTREESLDILKGSFIWEALDKLKGFDWEAFIARFDEGFLINITNGFIRDCLHDNDASIDDLDDLKSFYRIWAEHFDEVSDEWRKALLKEVDCIYERKSYGIRTGSYVDVIKSIWGRIKG
jgi:hypothetical protein